MIRRRCSILVAGMIAADPGHGGAVWAVLQYVLGLRRIGCDVRFLEPLKRAKLRPDVSSLRDSANARYFNHVIESFGLTGACCLLEVGTTQTVGLPYADLVDFARSADVLLNISGMLDDEALVSRIPVRAFVDLDPAFVQVWNSNYGIDLGFSRHTHFVTVGQAIGQHGCLVPDCGREWIKVRQPIVLEHWPVVRSSPVRGLTTIANWRGYGSVEHQGVFYGQKAHSWRLLMDLPNRSPEAFEPAVSIHRDETKDVQSLAANRWRCLDPADVAATPYDYRKFIQESKAELGIAKSGYVTSRCGWFSDRSVCYLASGRPVMAHDTGFTPFVPVGEGLFAFTSADDVLLAIDLINSDYPKHCKAARNIAENYFESDRVLRQLLDRIAA